LKTHPTYRQAELTFDVCEKTFRIHVWDTLEIMFRDLANVNIYERFDHYPETFYENRHLIIDATACRIQRPKDDDEQRLYYSGKHKFHCVKYEVATRVLDGRICWVRSNLFKRNKISK